MTVELNDKQIEMIKKALDAARKKDVEILMEEHDYIQKRDKERAADPEHWWENYDCDGIEELETNEKLVRKYYKENVEEVKLIDKILKKFAKTEG